VSRNRKERDVRENRLKHIWRSHGAAVIGQCSGGSRVTAELMAHQGYDGLLLDMQHGALDYGAMLTSLQAISTTTTAPVVRVAWNDPARVMQALDAGALAVIAPMINSAPECSAFVGACRYAPNGLRSWGPVRAALYAGADYFDRADELVLPLAMIETADAAAQAEEIAGVPGLGGIYIGPSDLSITLGLRPPAPELEEAALAIVDDVVRKVRKASVPVGIYAGSVPFAARMIKAGCQFVVMGSDMDFVAEGSRSLLSGVQSALRED